MLALCASPGLNHTYCVLWGRVLRLKCFEDFLALFSRSENRGIWTYSRMRICWDVYWSCGFGKLGHYSSACLGVCFRLLMTDLAHSTINEPSPPYLPLFSRIIRAQARFAASYRWIFSAILSFLPRIAMPSTRYSPTCFDGLFQACAPTNPCRAGLVSPVPAHASLGLVMPRLPDVAITRARNAAPCPGLPA